MCSELPLTNLTTSFIVSLTRQTNLLELHYCHRKTQDKKQNCCVKVALYPRQNNNIINIDVDVSQRVIRERLGRRRYQVTQLL